MSQEITGGKRMGVKDTAVKYTAVSRPQLNKQALVKGGLGAIFLLALLVVWLSPAEKTLGNGIKAVYVHVSLTWAGLAGFVTAALLALAQLLTGRQELASWRVTVGWVAFGFYLAGVTASAIASQVNWGAVFWQEPRMVTSLNVLAVALIVQIGNFFFPWWRLRAGLSLLLPFFIFWANFSAPLVLHPANPIRSSDATSIRLTFLVMFLLVATAEGLLVWLARPQFSPKNRSAGSA
jgi:hypothetical protein